MSTAQIVGNRIRVLRNERDLTLEELGTTTGLSKGQLSKIELGAPRTAPEHYERIAKALGVTVGDLFSASPSERRSSRSTRRDKANGGPTPRT
jgi:XRE family transcriptional regulator, regulator of sulfur utilization